MVSKYKYKKSNLDVETNSVQYNSKEVAFHH